MDTSVLELDVPRKMEAPNAFGATRFSMRGLPVLSQGSSFDPLASAENLWLSVKVYANGGENALHRHSTEDHSFVVIQGRATFEFDKGLTLTLKQYEGVMLPKGILYKFTAHEEENLVLMRIGGAQRASPGAGRGDLGSHGIPLEIVADTFDADAERKSATSTMSGALRRPTIKVPGKFFMKD